MHPHVIGNSPHSSRRVTYPFQRGFEQQECKLLPAAVCDAAVDPEISARSRATYVRFPA